jgi:hypothetical protein
MRPPSIGLTINLLQQRDIVVPGDLCKRPLHNCSVGPRGREGAHVPEVARRKSFHVRVGITQVGGQAVDDFRSPTRAGYWSARVGDTVPSDVAWTYDYPTRQVEPIAGLIDFGETQCDECNQQPADDDDDDAVVADEGLDSRG